MPFCQLAFELVALTTSPMQGVDGSVVANDRHDGARRGMFDAHEFHIQPNPVAISVITSTFGTFLKLARGNISVLDPHLSMYMRTMSGHSEIWSDDCIVFRYWSGTLTFQGTNLQNMVWQPLFCKILLKCSIPLSKQGHGTKMEKNSASTIDLEYYARWRSPP